MTAALCFDWPIIMIRPGGLLLVVRTDMQFLKKVSWVGFQKSE
jgi:hypothetical protein